MDRLREEMRAQWNACGWQYDDFPGHGIYDKRERVGWAELFAQCANNDRVLDIGTGTGFVAFIAAERGLRVTGVDWSHTMLANARYKASKSNLNVEFVQSDAEELPFGRNSFDVMTLRRVLWTLAEPKKAFREWRRVLKPGGRVFADYHPRQMDGYIGHHYNREIDRNLPLNRFIPPDEIVAMFRSAGFKHVTYGALNHQHKHNNFERVKTDFIFTCVK